MKIVTELEVGEFYRHPGVASIGDAVHRVPAEMTQDGTTEGNQISEFQERCVRHGRKLCRHGAEGDGAIRMARVRRGEVVQGPLIKEPDVSGIAEGASGLAMRNLDNRHAAIHEDAMDFIQDGDGVG